MTLVEWQTDAGSLAAFIIPGVLAPALLLVMAFVQPSERQVRRWGAVCGVAITEGNQEQVRSHLARVRRFRSIAALPFWWLMSVRAVTDDFPAALASPVPAISAYLVGALVAEVTAPRPRAAGPVRRAPLIARSSSDYAPRWIRRLPWMLIAVGAAATLLGRNADSSTSTRHGAVVVVLAAALAAAAQLAGGVVARRPQAGADPDALAADDGLRATGMSTALGAASLAGLMAIWAGFAAALPVLTGAWVFVVLPFSLAVYGFSIVLLCCIVRQETWGYRLRHRQRPTLVLPA